jgi:hypothetical protein
MTPTDQHKRINVQPFSFSEPFANMIMTTSPPTRPQLTKHMFCHGEAKEASSTKAKLHCWPPNFHKLAILAP